jgi:predicted lipoprotein with Yx(FWY)xxD motif
MNPLKRLIAGSMAIAIVVGACSSTAATPAPTDTPAPPSAVVAGPTATPATAATPAAATPAAATPAAGSATLLAKNLGGQTVLIAGSNNMTVYTFSNDTAGNGKSACTGGCLAKWPAVTVPAGATATGGYGVTGTIGTITRADNGALEVTYNGLPLYFYAGDTAPGDTNGSYPNWNLVKP